MSIEDLIIAVMQAKTFQASLAVILSFLVSHILPVAAFLSGILILVLTDLYTGIRAARKRKEAIRSDGLRKSVRKISDYFIAVLLSHLVQTIWLESLPLVYIVTLYIAITELKSNLENISELTGTDIWKYLGKMIAARIRLPK